MIERAQQAVAKIKPNKEILRKDHTRPIRRVLGKTAGAALRLSSEAAYPPYKKERELREYQATHDTLTGALNRRGLSEYLDKIGHPQALLSIDATGFKEINDTLGYKRGDEVIQATYEILLHGLREGDVVARLGGDEFLVVLHENKTNDERRSVHAVDTQTILDVAKTRIAKKTKEYRDSQPDLLETRFDLAVGGTVSNPDLSIEEMKLLADEDMKEHKAGQHKENGKYR